MRLVPLLSLVSALGLALPAGAGAAQRHAVPDGAPSGSCTAADPCALATAVDGAVAGDEVIVGPGTYTVSSPLKPLVPIDLHGATDQARPRIVASSGTVALEFKTGGSVRHLALEATSGVTDALTLEGGLAEDLILLSAGGDGAKVVGTPSTTVLRDSVVRTTSGSESAAALKLRDGGAGGDVALRNVTAMAPSGAARAIRCEVQNGDVTLVNVIARGSGGDVDASSGGARCSASHSSFRPALSPGLGDAGGNQSDDPLFADPAAGDYHLRAGSPAIDAGTLDPRLGSADPDGRARVLGPAPDIGAYEGFTGETPAPDGPADGSTADEAAAGAHFGPDALEAVAPDLRGVPVPVQGLTVVVAPGRGTVLVRRPGAPRFRRLAGATRIAVGSTIDARLGRVRLVSAIDRDRRVQSGTFWGAKFRIAQRRTGSGVNDLALRGGSFRACRTAASARRTAVASHADAPRRTRSRRVVRSLWGSDRNGRFRTHGRDSVATVRGTRWLTEDRCDGTLTRVRSGAVSVRDLRRGVSVLVRAGRAYLARG